MILDIRFEKVVTKNNANRFYNFLINAECHGGHMYIVTKGRIGGHKEEVGYRFGSAEERDTDLLARVRDRFNHGYVLTHLSGPQDLCVQVRSIAGKTMEREEKEGRYYLRLVRLREAFPELASDARLSEAFEALLARNDPRPNLSVKGRSTPSCASEAQLDLPLDLAGSASPGYLLTDTDEAAAVTLTTHLVNLLLEDFPHRHRAVRLALSNSTRSIASKNIVALRRSKPEGALAKSLFQVFEARPDLLEIAHVLADHKIRTMGQLIRLDVCELRRMAPVNAEQLRAIDKLCAQSGPYHLGMTTLKVM